MGFNQMEILVQVGTGEIYDTVEALLGPRRKRDYNYAEAFWNGLWKICAAQLASAIFATCGIIFRKHFCFRWRQAMIEYYTERWELIRHIEGSSQRIQEDTRLFATLLEGTGMYLFGATIKLCCYIPVLWELSPGVEELP